MQDAIPANQKLVDDIRGEDLSKEAHERINGNQVRFNHPVSRFYVGERFRLKGGVFAVRSIGCEAMVVRALPGTTLLAREMTTAEQCLPALQRIADALQDLPVSVLAVLSEGDRTIEGMAERAIRFYSHALLAEQAAAQTAAQVGAANETTILTDSA